MSKLTDQLGTVGVFNPYLFYLTDTPTPQPYIGYTPNGNARAPNAKHRRSRQHDHHLRGHRPR